MPLREKSQIYPASTQAYWKNRLSGEITSLNLARTRVGSKMKANKMNVLQTSISKNSTKDINLFIQKNNGDLFTFLLASWNVLFYRYTSQTDITIGTRAEGLILDNSTCKISTLGNTLVLRNIINPKEDFREFYKQVEVSTQQDFENPYPLKNIIDDLDLAHIEGRPLVNTILVLEKNAETENNKTHSQETAEELNNKLLSFDLEVSAKIVKDTIKLEVSFNPEVLENEIIEKILSHYKILLDNILTETKLELGKLNYLSKRECTLLVDEFSGYEKKHAVEKTVLHLIEEKTEKTPKAVALIFKEKKITYSELDVLTNQFANFLSTSHKTVRGDHIGIMLDRSEWLIISILGTLKAGGVYVPFDLDSPEKRKEYVQNDSRCKVIIDAEMLSEFIDSLNDFSPVLSREYKPNQEDLAYILYTSGTTGNPKGVMIEHGSVMNLISQQTELYQIEPTEKILQFSNYFFDASVEQIFLALTTGATLVMIDSEELKNHSLIPFLKKHAITHLDATPSYLETLSEINEIKSLKRIVAGGEACSLKLARRLAEVCDFFNAYGPTETTVTATAYKFSEANSKDVLPIGRPIGNARAYILSDSLCLQGVGIAGELCISGPGVARGYLNREKLTAEKFVENPFEPGNKMYRTGDLARWLPDGNIEFLGRKDNQVKIRGHRIELGEIEAALSQIQIIKQATVIISTHLLGEPHLVAYLHANTNDKDIGKVREILSEVLPQPMIPSFFMWVDEFPITPNGKIDKKKLPLPEYVRPDEAPPLRRPRTDMEKEIAAVWSEKLHIPSIGIDDNFFELGGNSILSKRVVSSIEERLDMTIPVTKIYQFPTIAEFSGHLEQTTPLSRSIGFSDNVRKKASSEVAVIGMAGRFPGALSIEELWDILKNGKETISFFSQEEIDTTVPESLRKDPLYVAARGVVPSAKEFDSKFFGINPKLAQAMDPQQRLFLEIAWEALEQAGHLPKHYQGSIGIYAGVGTNTYYDKNVLTNQELLNQVGQMQVYTVNEKDYVATRTAYHLNLKGPAVSVHSACSTSLLAIAEAVEAIRNGQCDVALAGGSSLTSPINSGHLYQEGSMLSSDGHCRSFDAEATGTVFSDGAGVVLLKNLSQAEKDGDIIYGVIKGVGINNDGGQKGSFTAPSVEGQADAIRRAIQDAKIPPSSISYLEAHGTATPLGDPIEMEGLKMAFGEQEENGFCAIGSIKSNMGHLTAAAGVAGLIKTLLAMNNRQIPPSLGFSKPNPAIDFENSPFFVNNRLRDWNVAQGLRRAGISSFGVGGTNVHVVVEEYLKEDKKSEKGRPLQILPWSAKSENSLKGYRAALGDFLTLNTGVSLADVEFSLNKTRDSFSHRQFILASDISDVAKNLLGEQIDKSKAAVLKEAPTDLAFLFPGQGAQYLQMGKSLYDHEDVFREAVDNCNTILKDELELDILRIIFPESDTKEAQNRLKDTQFTQPALFVIEYALAKLWMSWGIKPTMVCGHSIGEFVGAHLAGVFDLKDALRLITVRGRLVSELPGGSMLSVRVESEKLKEFIPEKLSIAAINSDKLCVVSGEDVEIENFVQVLKQYEVPHKLLATSHAFHSTMMEPVLEAFKKEVAKVKFKTPTLPIVSTVTGKWLKDEEAKSIEYWTDHLRATVRFSDAIDTMVELENALLLEVGPGRALTTLVRQKKVAGNLTAIPSLPIPKGQEDSYPSLLNALGQLWLRGIEPDWKAFYQGQERQKLKLPSYYFDKKPCWVEPKATKLIEIETIQPLPMVEFKNSIENTHQTDTPQMRKPIILKKIAELIDDSSGIEFEDSDVHLNFMELGLDSLILTQIALTCKREFNLPITFRQLNEDYNTPELLATYLDENLPTDVMAPSASQNNLQVQNQANLNGASNGLNLANNIGAGENPALSLIAQQLQLLGKQVEQLQANGSTTGLPKQNFGAIVTSNTENQKEKPPSNILSEEEKKEHKKPFGASPRIEKQSADLNETQLVFLGNLIKRYNDKTSGSKKYSQENRSHMADPRVVSGFKPLTKELVYPLVINKSLGNRLWDLDGNEYIDALNGFGSCFFGHQPDFVKEALREQIEQGFEVGPQHPLAGEVSELLCEFTGHERAALCNTGSEAVLGAMRIARTVTGRSLIVAFTKSYHGINDEGIVRGSKKLRTFPAAAGILPEAVQNMLVLDYGTDESLRIIRERAHELAAVLVEPVQSRRPDFLPLDFLKEVREITKKSETALIFDEVITGFRVHPGGFQAKYGIKADIATYGKVIGGGISIGAILGKREYLDSLDGGKWQYGDDSFPEIGVTYFAGTFVRHPLALASTKASLLFMKEKGEDLQNRLANMTEKIALKLNLEFAKRKLPIVITYFSSLWILRFKEDIPCSELLFVLLREKGIHIWDGFPCFLTDAYTQKDIDKIESSIWESIDEMIQGGFFSSSSKQNDQTISNYRTTVKISQPPIPGARLGRDQSGNPAWYVADPKKEGEYVKIDL